jgi:hypothetical protein
MLVKKMRKTPRREIGLARRQSERLGGRPGYLSDPAEAALLGVSARGGASAAAHERGRRGDALTEKYAPKPVIVCIDAGDRRDHRRQREVRLQMLDRSMAERGIDREHYSPPFPPPRAGEGRVADLRRYGTVARRLRPRPGFRRGHSRLRHRRRQRPRRDPLPANPGNARYRGALFQRSCLHGTPR